MAQLESNTHTFVVKIWLEEEPHGRRSGRWRGHVTHAYDRERRYLHELEDVLVFMAPYLRGMGVRLRLRSRLLLWLSGARGRKANGAPRHAG